MRSLHAVFHHSSASIRLWPCFANFIRAVKPSHTAGTLDNGIDYPYYLETIAISPLDSNTIYAVFSSKLYRSTDGGQNWKELKNSPSKKYNTFHNDIALTNDPNIIYVKAEGDIYSSADGGTNWKQPYQDNEEMDIDFFAVDPQNHKIIYAINHGKLYKSTNSGRKWKIILLPRA